MVKTNKQTIQFKFRKMLKRIIIFFFYSLFSVAHSWAQTENKFIREGNNFYKKNNFTDAEKSYAKSIEKNKESIDAQFNLGDALYKQKKYEDASNLFESLTKKAKDKTQLAQSYHNLGNSLLQNKKYEDCIKAYQNSLKINPKDEDTRYNLAYAKKKLEQQNQQNKDDKNKDNKNDKSKDQNQKNQDNKDQNKDDKKDQQQGDNKDSKGDKKDEQQNAQQQNKMSKEDAQRLLEAMNNQEKDVQDKLKRKKAVGVKVQIEKDW